MYKNVEIWVKKLFSQEKVFFDAFFSHVVEEYCVQSPFLHISLYPGKKVETMPILVDF